MGAAAPTTSTTVSRFPNSRRDIHHGRLADLQFQLTAHFLNPVSSTWRVYGPPRHASQIVDANLVALRLVLQVGFLACRCHVRSGHDSLVRIAHDTSNDTGARLRQCRYGDQQKQTNHLGKPRY